MDPVTLIESALVAGAAAGIQGATGEAIKDSYQNLRALIQRKFAGKPEAELALAKHEEKPEVWGDPIKDALVQTFADQDEEIIKTAQALLSLINPQQAAAGKYNVQITGNVQGFVQGDNAQVTMTFDKESSK